MSFIGGGVGRHGRCTTKVSYPSWRSAERAIEKREDSGHAAPGTLHVYHCKKGKCRRFHISGSQLKGRKGKR